MISISLICFLELMKRYSCWSVCKAAMMYLCRRPAELMAGMTSLKSLSLSRARLSLLLTTARPCLPPLQAPSQLLHLSRPLLLSLPTALLQRLSAIPLIHRYAPAASSVPLAYAILPLTDVCLFLAAGTESALLISCTLQCRCWVLRGTLHNTSAVQCSCLSM